MKIKELYKPGTLASVDLGESLSEAADKMAGNEVGALAVMKGGRFVGILSERDLVVSMTDEADSKDTQVGDYMTPEPMTAEPLSDAEEVIGLMLEAGVRHMPVTDNGSLVGMVSLRDLIALAVWPSMQSS
ncbi:MAG: CBS domain-containing protein [Actinomycetota bacterium]